MTKSEKTCDTESYKTPTIKEVGIFSEGTLCTSSADADAEDWTEGNDDWF